MPERYQIFAVSPRNGDVDTYWQNVCKVIDLSEKHNFAGVLLFTGNDTLIEPWIAAQELLKRTTHLCPLIALNPIYMHPFTVAKLIASLVRLHGRTLYLNMVIGTALSHQQALSDQLQHDARYDRLREFIEIIKYLLDSKRPLTFKGEHYQTNNLQLFPGISSQHRPEFLLSGQSDAARRVCNVTGSTGVQMLPSNLEDILHNIAGIHFGIISRKTDRAAWNAAAKRFPEADDHGTMLQHSMSNTDAVWKHRMKEQSASSVAQFPEYWLEPFLTFRADCPYIVGSDDFVVDKLQQLTRKGLTTFLLDIPPTEEDFDSVNRVLKKSRLRQ